MDIVSSFQNIRPHLTDVSLPSLDIETYTDDKFYKRWSGGVGIGGHPGGNAMAEALLPAPLSKRLNRTNKSPKKIHIFTDSCYTFATLHMHEKRGFLNTEGKSIKNKRFLISWKLFWPKEGLHNKLPQTPEDGKSTKVLRNHKVFTKWQKQQSRDFQHQ